MSISRVNAILEAVAAESSRTGKEAILKKGQANADLKVAISLALDPFTQFYIRKIPAVGKRVTELSLANAMYRLEALSERKVTGNAAIAHLKDILERVSEDDAMVIERIIKKDLDCGVSEATANKIWKDLIPVFPCMLASAHDDKLLAKMRFPAIAQLKMDGMRFAAIVDANKKAVEYRSRNGKLIEMNGDEMDGVFLEMAKNVGMAEVVFDGELLVVDANEKPLERKIGNGILNKAVKGTIAAKERGMIRATLWDIIPKKFFLEGKCPVGYHDRLVTLVSAIDNVTKNKSLVSVVSTDIVMDLSDANTIFSKYIEAGQEGIILKDMNAPWEDKRAKHQVKFKGVEECDLLCVGWEEGEGKYAGMMGTLCLESADGGVKVRVGTGFTDEMRKNITEASVVGKIVAVKYNARITKANGGADSLFLPVFTEVREDKTTADHSSAIK